MEATATAEAAPAAPPPTSEPAAAEPAATTETTTAPSTTAESAPKGDTLVNGSDGLNGDAPAEGQEATTEGATDKVASDAGDGAEVTADGEQPAKAADAPEGDDKAAESVEGEEISEGEGDNLEGLPEDFNWRDLATDEKSRNRLNQFESMDDLAKFIRDADSWRRRAVIPPNSKSTPEDVAKYHKAIGVPESPDGYEVELSDDATDDDKERVDRLRGAAHGVHATPAQLSALVQWHQSEVEAIAARETEEFEQQLAEAKTELSRVWGPDYQRNAGVAVQTMKSGGADQFSEDWSNLELKNGTKIGNHPWTMQIFSKLGRRFGEAGIPGDVAPDGWAPTEAELIKMQNEPGYVNNTDPVLIARVKEGYKRLYPS